MKRCFTGKPEPPKYFRIIDNTVTDSTVTLTWSPGFNCGLQQTFVFLYKKNFEMSWFNNSIIDNGQKTMFYAIYGLSSNKEYEVEMYAKNKEGKSVRTERLQFKTKGEIETTNWRFRYAYECSLLKLLTCIGNES